MNANRLVLVGAALDFSARAELVVVLAQQDVRVVMVEGPLDAALRDVGLVEADPARGLRAAILALEEAHAREPLPALDLPAFDLPVWTEPNPRTDRRARRDPGGRRERRDYGRRGLR